MNQSLIFRGNILISILLFTVSASFISCNKILENSKNEIIHSYRLEKEHEFLIHSLTSVEILDYYPEEKIYLGYTYTANGKEILLLDESGKILLQKNKQGEGPDQHSANLSCLAFSETGDIWAMTSVEILLYDKNLKVKKRFKYQPSNILHLYTISKKFSYFKKDTSKSDITFATIPTGTSRFNPQSIRNFNKAKLFELYDQKSSSISEFSFLSERQITDEFLGLVGGFYAPIYSIDAKSSKLFLTSTFDGEITIYDLLKETLIGKISIKYEDPSAVDSSSKLKLESMSKTPDGWLKSPKNQSIHVLENGLFAIEYIREVLINPGHKNTAEISETIYNNRLILFNQKNQLSNDIIIPERGIIMTSLPGNRLLVKLVNPDKEEDFTRFTIYRIEII
ncbi:hypothetical protein SAMN04488519_104145 [Algoriphagus ornithinivorans]|uniref:TolB-like 6-blade propeller-like n=1 Tax=Algoriphagus ornithinivorans TaxID=226506 RepID=A0A1I5EZP9_9BACT|nr:hypothetical protein [Algoriphagus ornithinivorans]SFO16998.1 hypothetical protein SAMN04488519_104145 [Algoriphagus ornithinivorans]